MNFKIAYSCTALLVLLNRDDHELTSQSYVADHDQVHGTDFRFLRFDLVINSSTEKLVASLIKNTKEKKEKIVNDAP